MYYDVKIPEQKRRDNLMKSWAKEHGLKRSPTDNGLRYLRRDIEYGVFPARDHVSYWSKDGKPYCIVSQPYHIYSEDIEMIAHLCGKYDLDCEIDAYPAWHYPGAVVHMTWTKKK